MARNYRSSLTALQFRRLRTLPVLLEDDPIAPSELPEYQQLQSDMDSENSTTSKRKRESIDGSPVSDGDVELNTPKRSRPSIRSTGSNATLSLQHGIRRKRGIQNLSNLSLEHATDPNPLSPRGSKFQEGSLSDRPSEAPPSVYTRAVRTDSGNLIQMDELMADYHDGQHATQPSASHGDGVEMEAPETAAYGHGTGFLRLGRTLANSFHPVNLWNRIWNEQREELTRQHILDAERQGKLKSEAESKYAEMKRTGQFGFHAPSVGTVSEDMTSTPYDSAVSLESDARSQNHKRISSLDSHLLSGRAGLDSREESDVPSTASKALRSIRSRLYLKRPSLSNLKNDLKRVRSDVNISVSAHRESSSSASPVKAEFDSSLKRSHSKFDLKKQHKLSKRVSDLELKLRLARKELEDALAEASPAPKLGNKYERFTPTPTLKRPKFVPGRLPTLPSEGVLFPGLAARDTLAESGEKILTDSNPSEEWDNEETIKVSRERQYPTRASTLFQIDAELPTTSHSSTIQQVEAAAMDPNSVKLIMNENIEVKSKTPQYSDLDHKLKALDQSYKASRKSTTSKKRKSGDRDDGVFRLGKDDDDDDNDDAEWDEANETPKKRRKSGGVKPKASQEKVSDNVKAMPKMTKTKKGKKAEKQAQIKEAEPESDMSSELANDADDSAFDHSSQVRNSLDMQAHQLEPLYEEEEDVIIIPLKDEPSKPTAKATPARYGHSRLLSPQSQIESAEVGLDAVINENSAEAIQADKHVRSASPPPGEYSMVMEVIDEAVTAVPGKDGVPALPNKAGIGTERGSGAKEKYQWPDDVF